MKHIHILIALAMLAALTMVSCKNNKKSQSQEPTQEEVQEMKQALADSVLAKIDEFAEQYLNAKKKSFTFRSRELTDNEKAIKPDYLLEPSVLNSLVTKSQKINAIGILIVDLGVRYLYGMPVDETKEAIAKLALELNFGNDFLSASENQQDVSEIVKNTYYYCKANNELYAFWQYSFSVVVEAYYIISNNPELYISKISENEWHAFIMQIDSLIDAIEELAKYDEEMAAIKEFRNNTKVIHNNQEKTEFYSSLESAKQTFIVNKDKYTARRNALLQ